MSAFNRKIMMDTDQTAVLSPQTMQAINEAPVIKCECGCHTFVEAVAVKKISGLLIGVPEDRIVPVPVYICSKCGKINAELAKMAKLPENVWKEDEKPIVQV